MTPAGWFGVWLLVGSSIAVVIELTLMGLMGARLGRRARMLAVAAQTQRSLVEEDVARLRAALEETRMLWRPYARALRWLRHPLVVALIGSYRRRWARSAAR